jgi:hypothetical protein
MKLADINNALGTARPHYRFYLTGGQRIVGRSSGISPTNDLIIILYDLHEPPAAPAAARRVLIAIDHIVAIEEL